MKQSALLCVAVLFLASVLAETIFAGVPVADGGQGPKIPAVDRGGKGMAPGERMAVGHNRALNPVAFEAPPAGTELILVEAGEARAAVVVPDGARADRQGVEMVAAREWVEHVQLATGAKMAIVEEKDAPPAGALVLIGDGVLARRFGMVVDDLPLEGFRVRTFETDGRAGLMIAGRQPKEGEPRAPNGTLFGVYDALERFVGVRWYYPGDDGRVVPETADLAIYPVAYVDAPTTLKRDAWVTATGMDWRTMIRRYRVGNSSSSPFTACHTPGSWRIHRDAHPETFELLGSGRRHRDMPCYGNPKTAEVYFEDIVRFYETGDTSVWIHPHPNVDSAWHPPSAKVIPISPPDKGVECRCDYCLPLYDETAGRHGRASRVVAQHVRLVAEKVRERWPDKLVWYLPYANYTVPPGDLELPDNVVVGICLMQGAANAKEAEVAANHDRWIREWRRATGRKVHLWEYLCWPADDTALPFQYPHVLQAFYRRHRDTVEGSFINGGYAPPGLRGENYASFHPTLYCWMRLMWNPDFDVDAALAEYVELMYGPAAEPMARLLDSLTRRWQGTRWESVPTGHHVSPRQIHQETMPRDEALKLAAWLAEARGLAGEEGLHRRRVDFLGAAVDLFLEESRQYHEQTGVQTLPVLKVGDLPVVDGRLDDAAWRDAPAQAFVNARDPRKPEPEAPSTVQAVWTEEGVVFGFHFSEPLPDKMRAERTAHDQDVYADDCIEIFIDALGARSEYVQIIVNSIGTVFDRHSDQGVDWHAEGLRKAIRIGEDAWTLELFVPFEALPGGENPPAVGTLWYGNFIRSRHAAGPWQLTRWSTRHRYSNLDFGAFGRLRFVE